jgi:hypothetical protein
LGFGCGAGATRCQDRLAQTGARYFYRGSNEANGCTPAGFAADGVNLFTGVKTGG